ncbi:NAD(P)H-dependent glycerol-3-phosphate dehydrogenase [Candidatus Bipolaricaulota bacterium]
MRFAVVGAGGWGTAVARMLANAGHETLLWAREPGLAEEIATTRRNVVFLPGVELPTDNLTTTDKIEETVAADVLMLAVPSFAMKEMLDRIAQHVQPKPVMVNLAKGLDPDSRRTMTELVLDRLPEAKALTLSGPSHAEEVARDMPTAVVLAGQDAELGQRLQRELSTTRFRVYLSTDVRGVELCGTIKNVIALASGISDGLGYGDNSRGALITRGLAEMVRFGRPLGVRNETFFGLSGLGDLVATCTSDHSRNRYVGYRLGRGDSIEQILSEMATVAEGVRATRSVHEIAREKGIEMPITEAVCRLLSGEADPLSLVDEIMTRSPKREGQ